jgi:hypothetical protein
VLVNRSTALRRFDVKNGDRVQHAFYLELYCIAFGQQAIDLLLKPLFVFTGEANFATQAYDFAFQRFAFLPLAFELLDRAVDLVLEVRELFQTVDSAHSAPILLSIVDCRLSIVDLRTHFCFTEEPKLASGEQKSAIGNRQSEII